MREIKDTQLQVSGALPNAANTVNTNVIDLGQSTPFPVLEGLSVRINSTTSTGANSKNINIRVMHSNESNANFTNLAELANPVLRVTDNSNAGYPAGEANFTLPPTTRRYLKFAALGEANGGNAGDGSFTAKLLF